MNSIRRGLILLGLTVAVILGASVPASATYAESIAVSTAIATTDGRRPRQRGRKAHLRPAGDDVGHLDPSGTTRVSGYPVSVYFSDGFVQTVELGPTPPAGAPRSTRTTSPPSRSTTR